LSISTLSVTAIEIKEQSNKVIKKKWNINEKRTKDFGLAHTSDSADWETLL
jgi:hypothetical protein